MTRTFVLAHEHTPSECPGAYAAWRGFDSPLRHGLAMASCAFGDHRVFWTVNAETAEEALAQLPPFVARRTRVSEVTGVPIP
jgi:hypothetical protein